MWINNYDDPEEMGIETALNLLRVNRWRNAPRTSDEIDVIEYLFVSPDGELHPCEDDDEVIELVITLELVEPEQAS
jgi:hypothetical protein